MEEPEQIIPCTIYFPASLLATLQECAKADKRKFSPWLIMYLSKCDKKALLKKITS